VALGAGATKSGFGEYLKVIGDLDGDGIAEWGSWVLNFTDEFQPDFVDLFDGASGTLIAEIQGFDPGELFGFNAISEARDANGDGIADLLIGAFLGKVPGVGRPGAAYLYSTSDFHLIHRFHAIEPDDSGQFGWAVLLAPGLAGDGRSEVVVGAPLARVGDESGVGDVQFFRFSPGLEADATRISASAGGTVHFDLDFPDSESGFRYGLLLSLGTGPTTVQGVKIPLSKDRWFRRSLEQKAPAFLTPAFGRLDPLGDAQAVFSPPPGALIKQIGRTFHLAAVTRDTNRRLSVSSVEVPLTIDP